MWPKEMIERLHSLWQDGQCKYGHDDATTSYDNWMGKNVDKNHTEKNKEEAISVIMCLKK